MPGSDPYDAPIESARIGMTRAETMELAGGEDPIAGLAAKAVETPLPADSTFLHAEIGTVTETA